MTDQRNENSSDEVFDAHAFSTAFRERFEASQASKRFTPEQLEVIYGVGYAHVQQQQWQEALPVFQLLFQYGPTRQHYLAGLALCMRELGHFADAKRVYSLMLLIFPDQLESAFSVAECLLAQGDMSAAQATLSELVDVLDDGDPLRSRSLALMDRLRASHIQR